MKRPSSRRAGEPVGVLTPRSHVAVDDVNPMTYDPDMKTIAVTIDPATLASIDHLLTAPAGSWKSRSELVRQALQEFVREAERRREEEHETVIYR